jgi:hypothetical protein
VFVATSTVAVFSFLAAILCLLAPSDDTARTVAYSPQLEPAYIFGLASYGTYLISEALKLWVAADDAHRTLTAPTAAVAVCGTVTATLHLFGYAPVWAISRLGDDGQLLTVLPLRHLTWAVTTGLLAYIVWVSAVGVPVEWLYRYINRLVVRSSHVLRIFVLAHKRYLFQYWRCQRIRRTDRVLRLFRGVPLSEIAESWPCKGP